MPIHHPSVPRHRSFTTKLPSTTAMAQHDELDDSTIEVTLPTATHNDTGLPRVAHSASVHDHAHPSPTNYNLGLDGTSDSNTPDLGPRRGSFTADIPSGFTMPKPINPVFPGLVNSTSNDSIGSAPATKPYLPEGPTTGVNINLERSPVHANDRDPTDSDPEFKTSKPLRFVTNTPASLVPTSHPQQQGVFGMLHLNAPRPSQMGPPDREPKTSSRRVKNYTLTDGTVVSGKGLGRGRPGVKRGPRNPKYRNGDPDAQSPSPYATASPGATPLPSTAATAAKKRKRTDSDASGVRTRLSTSVSVTSGSRDSSPEYNPTEETRSGRKVQKPTGVPNELNEGASPATKRPRLDMQTSASPAVPKHHPKIKRRIYRGREQLALCEHCLRGHGPPGNVIVFCDACNKCWHQHCHDPQVPQSVIADTKAEWFCTNCDRILHGRKGKKSKGAKAAELGQPPTPAPPAFVGPLIGGSALSRPQRTSYLQSLSKDRLISLILSAAELAPALPLFQAPAPQLPQAQFVSNYTTPVSSTPNHHTAAIAAEEDEGYDSYFDEHAMLYPKPGEGVKLPPESLDLHMLLESQASRTFSHWVRGMPGPEFSGTGDVRVG